MNRCTDVPREFHSSRSLAASNFRFIVFGARCGTGKRKRTEEREKMAGKERHEKPSSGPRVIFRARSCEKLTIGSLSGVARRRRRHFRWQQGTFPSFAVRRRSSLNNHVNRFTLIDPSSSSSSSLRPRRTARLSDDREPCTPTRTPRSRLSRH